MVMLWVGPGDFIENRWLLKMADTQGIFAVFCSHCHAYPCTLHCNTKDF